MVDLAGGDVSEFGGTDPITTKPFGVSLLRPDPGPRDMIHMIRSMQGCQPDEQETFDVPLNDTVNAVTYQSRWKYIQGTEVVLGWYDGGLPNACLDQACLFDLSVDPTERANVASEHA